jgi:hypothetical protein
MKRRQVLIAACTFAVIDSSVLAQKPVAIPRIGLLWIESGSDSTVRTAFSEGLRAQAMSTETAVDTNLWWIVTIAYQRQLKDW